MPRRKSAPPPVVKIAAASAPDDFDEAKYLRAFADVAEAVRNGDYPSALDHYTRHGRGEHRLEKLEYRHGWPILPSDSFPGCGIDTVFADEDGRHLIIGWINDQHSRLTSMSLLLDETMLGVTRAIARCRREDADQAMGAHRRELGFWTMLCIRPGVTSPDLRLVLATDTAQLALPVTIHQVGAERLRDIALEYFAQSSHLGDHMVQSFGNLDGGLGETLIAMNARIATRLAAAAWSRRFGPQAARFTASLIVCLYGRAEYLFLQSAFFTAGDGCRGTEFIYVCNSPELADILCREAAIAGDIYGVAITLVLLPGNAGFGIANNVAAGFARSDRILIVNPDVFPRHRNWASHHEQLVAGLPTEQTRLFGATLFYDDGSLMHGGMYFDIDEGLSVRDGAISARDLVRVEHYGKGAPPGTRAFLASRPVPAVTGAFMSIDRAWFERLGGFSADYVLGHYEDADLCLKSLDEGVPVWLHDLPFWHLEGKGSPRSAVHEGGGIVNRWHFTRRWGELIRMRLPGRRGLAA